MLSYILRRLLLILPTLIGITMLVFFVMKLSPGDVATVLQSAEGDMRAEERKRIQEYVKKRYGLDDPVIVQYFRWLNHISPVGIKYPGTKEDFPRLERIYERYRAAGQSPQQAIENLTLNETFRGEEVAVSEAGDLVVSRIRPGEGWPATWRVGFKAPDMGQSFLRRRPVLDMILEALPITLLLNLITIPIVYGVAITSGIYAAKHRGKAFDVGSGVTFIGLYSLPTMWVGVMLLGFFASRDYWQWFPTGGLHDTLADRMSFLPSFAGGQWQRGWLLDVLWHLVLPVICLTYGGYAFLSKLMRASVLENLHADFARTARAKGLKENVVLMRHVLSNSVLPLITVAASILPGLLGGSVIVEEIFSINGMGRMMLEAIKQKDQEVVLSQVCVVAVISLLSLLAADICYALADPRVGYE